MSIDEFYCERCRDWFPADDPCTLHGKEKAMVKCAACGHFDAHSGGGIGVCVHPKCGCDGPCHGSKPRLDSPAYDPPPKHYDSGRGLDPWQVWDAFGLDCDAYLANVVKYVLRAGKKGPKMPDLIKARNYLHKAIEREAER